MLTEELTDHDLQLAETELAAEAARGDALLARMVREREEEIRALNRSEEPRTYLRPVAASR